MDFTNVNFLSVIVSGIAAWVLGAIWYSPALFSKRWQKEAGLSDDDIKQANMAVIFGGSLVLMIVMALGLALHIQTGDPDLMRGLRSGLLTGVFFSATIIGINYLYQRRSMALWCIDAVYAILFMGLEGVILGVWQ